MTGRWSRRRFLGAAAAAACVGCSESEPDSVAFVEQRGLDEFSDPSSDRPVPFAGPVRAGSVDEILAAIDDEGAFYAPSARSWRVRMPEAHLAAALDAYDEQLHEGLAAGLMALSQKCPHLGCRVPLCSSSGWFECYCHGSMFSATGEHRGGPGPRGLDLLPVLIDDDDVQIETRTVIPGLPVDTVVVDRAPSGPRCVGGLEP